MNQLKQLQKAARNRRAMKELRDDNMNLNEQNISLKNQLLNAHKDLAALKDSHDAEHAKVINSLQMEINALRSMDRDCTALSNRILQLEKELQNATDAVASIKLVLKSSQGEALHNAQNFVTLLNTANASHSKVADDIAKTVGK